MRNILPLMLLVIMLSGCDRLLAIKPPATWMPPPTMAVTPAAIAQALATATLAAATASPTVKASATVKPTVAPGVAATDDPEIKAIWARDLVWSYMTTLYPEVL